MEFVNPALLAGAALAVLPLIIHLILRERPRREIFPALRLLRYRHRFVTRRLRVRHLLLLALRIALILFIALTLARPRLTGVRGGFDERAPAAAALVFDTSLSMEYRSGDESAFEQARHAARQLLEELPDQSEVMVLDAASPDVAVVMRPREAMDRLESLRLRADARDLTAAILEALRHLRDASIERKELYIFSDLMAGSLTPQSFPAIQKALEEVPGGVAVCVFDVGQERAENVAVLRATPTKDSVPAHTGLTIRVQMEAAEKEASGRLELYIDDQLRGQRPVQLRPGSPIRHDFIVRGLEPGFHRGVVRFRGPRVGLDFDDQWFFTVEVRPPTKVLIAAPSAAAAQPLAQALAPKVLVRVGKERHRVQWRRPDGISAVRPGEYDVVYLLDVPGPSASGWRALANHVRAGGGLGIFLGEHCRPEAYQTVDAQGLLPAAPQEPVDPLDPVRLEATETTHPIVRPLHEWNPAALGRVVIYKYWKLSRLEGRGRVVLRYSDGQPAMVESLSPADPAADQYAMGKVVLVGTPVTTAPILRRWNDLPQSAATFVILMDSLTLHLAGVTERRWNWTAGEDVILRVDPPREPTSYSVIPPEGGVPGEGTLAAGQRRVLVPAPQHPGHYRLVAKGGQLGELVFAVNAPRRESRLERLSRGQLMTAFTEERLVIARTVEQMREAMATAGMGRELLPLLLAVLVFTFIGEHYLANRFYDQGGVKGAGNA